MRVVHNPTHPTTERLECALATLDEFILDSKNEVEYEAKLAENAADPGKVVLGWALNKGVGLARHIIRSLADQAKRHHQDPEQARALVDQVEDIQETLLTKMETISFAASGPKV